jgi:hypothetical protein
MAYGQPPRIDRVAFFNDSTMLNVTLLTNMNKLLRHNGKRGADFPGNFVTHLADSTAVNDRVLLQLRGHMRLNFCYVPPVWVVFNYDDQSILRSLKALKLVSACKTSTEYEQYLLKEYIVYKIYNLLTDRSFRVRLLNLSWQDSAGKKKDLEEKAFLLEDIKEVAKRNNCKEFKNVKIHSYEADRKQMTMVCIFEYMIGNTDWSVSVGHNIKLITLPKDSTKGPIPIPYDFDYSGFVNTDYSIPDERLNLENVRQRLYRGYPRTMDELQEALSVFTAQKKNIYDLINNFDLLTPKSKRETIEYLESFYDLIKDPYEVRANFIDDAMPQ